MECCIFHFELGSLEKRCSFTLSIFNTFVAENDFFVGPASVLDGLHVKYIKTLNCLMQLKLIGNWGGGRRHYFSLSAGLFKNNSK